MDNKEEKPAPKRSCMITLMFPIDSDKQAIEIKHLIDDAIAEIEEKRYTFQINES